MQFVDHLWFAVLEVAASGSDALLIGTIVGEVNAVTGEVIDVRLEPPPQ